MQKSKVNLLTGSQLRQALLSALSRREHARRELFDKFSNRVESSDELDSMLDAFAESNWQSDYRYARSLIRSKYNNNYGPRVIKQLLQQQEISPDIFQQIVNEECIDWYQSCLDVASKKSASLLRRDIHKLYSNGDIKDSDIPESEYIGLLDSKGKMSIKNKLIQYLLRRGFANDDCWKASAELDLI